MSREILIQVGKNERRVAIIENGRIEDFHIEIDSCQSLLGNIYRGRVESILPSINAAFVNIGEERNGFLYLTDAVSPFVEDDISTPRRLLNKILRKVPSKVSRAKKARQGKDSSNDGEIPLSVGQEILVQVVKDPFGDKGPRLTTHITLPGRFIVYMPLDKHTGVSKKIENIEERQRLREIVKSFSFATAGGFIIRTVAQKKGKRELTREAKFLYKRWQQICKNSERANAPALIGADGDLTWRIVRDYLTEKVDKLIIDSEEEYVRIQKYVENLIGKQMVSKIHYYKGSLSLFDAKHVSKELKKIYDTHVYCRSGAYIVIERTEGLTVVDVNSGKFRPKASPEDAAFMVNMEVVPEIARQLRLRDLGGIIVIDFIDMSKAEHNRKVFEALQRALAKDRAKTEVYRISPLGLVEMTRARTGKAIESIYFNECPFCKGRGRVRAY